MQIPDNITGYLPSFRLPTLYKSTERFFHQFITGFIYKDISLFFSLFPLPGGQIALYQELAACALVHLADHIHVLLLGHPFHGKLHIFGYHIQNGLAVSSSVILFRY